MTMEELRDRLSAAVGAVLDECKMDRGVVRAQVTWWPNVDGPRVLELEVDFDPGVPA